MHFLFLLTSEIHVTLCPDAYVSVQRFIERDSMPNAAYHFEGSPPSRWKRGDISESARPPRKSSWCRPDIGVEGGEKDLVADQNDGKGGSE